MLKLNISTINKSVEMMTIWETTIIYSKNLVVVFLRYHKTFEKQNVNLSHCRAVWDPCGQDCISRWV